MRDDCQTLDYALNLFGEDERGTFIAGHAQDIAPDLAMGRGQNVQWTRIAQSNLVAIAQHFWSLATVVDRLEWMRSLSIADPESAERWRHYAAVDIQAVHVHIRSILDHVARIVAALCPKPHQVPTSFRKLLEWSAENTTRIPVDLLHLVREQDGWFGQVRRVRDQLIHQGGQTLVFGKPQDGILFQIYDDRLANLIQSEPSLLFNPNVVHFDRYAALCLARLMACLEDLGAILRSRASSDRVLNAKAYGPGFDTLRAWMTQLRSLLCPDHHDTAGAPDVAALPRSSRT